VSKEGRGGHWNRAGRRSGGSRPVEILIPPMPTERFECPECHNADLPVLITSGCQMCKLIVDKHARGELAQPREERRG
jgi:hypothetical protein